MDRHARIHWDSVTPGLIDTEMARVLPPERRGQGLDVAAAAHGVG
jgi:hypothetical protein